MSLSLRLTSVREIIFKMITNIRREVHTFIYNVRGEGPRKKRYTVDISRWTMLRLLIAFTCCLDK